MDFTLHPATPEDAQGIAAVQVAAWRERLSVWAPDWFVRQFDPRVQADKYYVRIEDPAETLFVAEDKAGTVLGFVAARPHKGLPCGYDASIYGFYVKPGFERRGIGSALLRRLCTALKEKGAQAALVFTFRDNIPARQCYATCGGVLLPFTESPDLADIGLAHVSYGFDLQTFPRVLYSE